MTVGAAVTAAQNATVTAGKDVNVNANVTATAGDAVVVASNGSVTMAAGTVLTAGKNAAVEGKTGVALAAVNASTASGTVAVKSSDGSITDANGDDAANVTAKNASFSAANGAVGTGANHVDTAVETVAATAKDGVFLTEGNGVTVGEVAAVTAQEVGTAGTTAGKTTAAVSGLSTTGSGAVVLEATAGDVTVDKAVSAAGADGNVLVAAKADGGSVTVGAAVTAAQNATIEAKGNITINSDVVAKTGDVYVESKNGSITMDGGTEIKAGDDAYLGAKKIAVATVTAGDAAWIESTGAGGISSVDGKDGLNVNAKKLRLEANGNIGSSEDPILTNVDNIEAVSTKGSVNFADKDGFTIGGISSQDLNPTKVKADGSTLPNAKKAKEASGISAAGDVGLTANGTMTIQEDVTAGSVSITVKNGSLLQTGGDNTVHVRNGVAESKTLKSAINSAGGVTLNVSGSIGTVGKDEYSFVGVQGPVTASGGGDVAIGAANGTDLQVNNISAVGNAAVYTTGTITGNAVGSGGGSISGQNVHITAHDFQGGIVNIAVRKELVSNNIKGGHNPQIAIYKTASGGKDNPEVENNPNGSIVFLDGRLIGGDIQTINKLGAMEAFPVQTPELKSEQGVFGNPTFLHDELGVANPLAVGVIDFLLQEIPVLTLSSDFPIEVEKQVAANGLSPTTSYWFGQKSEDDESEADDTAEPNDSDDASKKSNGGDETPIQTAKK